MAAISVFVRGFKEIDLCAGWRKWGKRILSWQQKQCTYACVSLETGEFSRRGLKRGGGFF